MATKFESECSPSPDNYESEGEGEELIDQKEDSKPPAANNVENLLKRLQSSGALITKPKQEYRCYTCDEDFLNWEELENHLITHVSLPSVLLTKLPSDDEDMPSGDEWSDEEEEPPPPTKVPQKIDISQILKNPGLSIKKPADNKVSSSDSALSKLSGLGFTIKKNSTPIKQEKSDDDNDIMKKLDKLGGIKLKLKSDGNNTNTFKVINGLKDFNASDDEEEDENKLDQGDFDDEQDKSGEQGSDEEKESAEEIVHNSRKNSESDDSDKTPQVNKKDINIKSIKGEVVKPITEPENSVKIPTPLKIPVKSGRPVVKQTPKRGANLPIVSREYKQMPTPPTQAKEVTSTAEKRESHDINMENVTVKQEVNTDAELQSSNVNIPLFSGQIKTERTSPPPSDPKNTSNNMTVTVKTEAEPTPVTTTQPLFYNENMTPSSSCPTPLLPVTKKEDTGVTIIEINGDSNDEDDDCCVVSATPAPDVKPIVPKTEPTPSYPSPASYTSSQASYNTSSVLSHGTPSTEKQHSFDWNAPDSKPPIDILEKSADDIFESLLSSSKKESNMSSLSDASEYISLDTLGPQHSCDVCNTRFTDVSLLEEHRRTMGHSKSLVASSSSTLLPYGQSSSNILQSLLPVKQLAEQVGKLSGIGGTGPGFTHQQNVMINIQAYPGASGMMPPQPYNTYPPGANMHPGFPQTSTSNMYGTGQTIPGPYSGQNYMGSQGYGQQFQSPMSQSGYPGPIPPNSYASTPYSTESPLQSMQQSVYGQPSSSLSQSMGQMGPPGSMSSPYAPVTSPGGSMKPPTNAGSGIKIQNVQTFPPGHMVGTSMAPGTNIGPGTPIAPGTQIGQAVGQGGNQMPSPNQIRMAAGVNVSGQRPRMTTVRGARPTIRPGIQVHGQIRGAKPGGPRMPMKRPGGMAGAPLQKKRTDMLLPGKHDNEDCQVMAMQKQREGLPMIQSVQGAKDKLNLGSQISITKKTVNKEANAMASVLASRGICVKQKQKSRSPSPERPLPHIPNLGSGVSIKHTSKSSNFTIPEAKVGGHGMLSCKICKKMFGNNTSLTVHMANAHPQSKIPVFKCDECPASYPKSLQLQHHKRVFHNVTGPNRELGLPVVDLSQEENLKRLSNLGIYSFIPLANREQANGCFGIPVISVHNVQNGMISSLQALGADGLLSLGPLKPLPNS